ncbi:hypothetical protein Q8A67_018017 [Cirrhinus molitorella]|uniref:Uncharacterized protein n=1 Tax=Cirrhinus molitorella TaxID=172907 RepID=A0AA88PGU6_9TELE|nr:hypothetical protein Q8A67_018017 [Cirrhinus molitorella]
MIYTDIRHQRSFSFRRPSGASVSGLRAQVLAEVMVVRNYRAVARWSAPPKYQPTNPSSAPIYPPGIQLGRDGCI